MLDEGTKTVSVQVVDEGDIQVEEGRRLVLGIQDAGIDILHRCGGNARCTTFRVEFIDGEPSRHTKAEEERLAAKGLTGVRLSCQILCDHDMTVRAISRLEGSGRPDPGGPPPTSPTSSAAEARSTCSAGRTPTPALHR